MAAIATHTHTHNSIHTYMYVYKVRTDGGSQFCLNSNRQALKTQTSFDAYAYARLSYLRLRLPLLLSQSPSPACFSIPSLLVILHFCAPFVSACTPQRPRPRPLKVVWRLWRMQINVGSGNSVLGIMQIFSQYFLLFVVGFSFRFLNNSNKKLLLLHW